MTAGYDLSTSWSQHFHQISLENPEETQGNKRDFRVVSVCRLPQFFRLFVLFNQGISRNISRDITVVFPPYIIIVWSLFLVKGGIIQVLWLGYCMHRRKPKSTA